MPMTYSVVETKRDAQEALRAEPAWLGADLILAERRRQMEVWSAEHDDKHQDGELAQAAFCYLSSYALDLEDRKMMPEGWPWEAEWWKPSDDMMRDLVKAGALIAAEIDRILRRRPKAPVTKRRKAPNNALCDGGPLHAEVRRAFLHLDGWEGRTRQAVLVLGETKTRYRIGCEQTVRLAGRCRSIAAGETALVPKYAISFTETQAPNGRISDRERPKLTTAARKMTLADTTLNDQSSATAGGKP